MQTLVIYKTFLQQQHQVKYYLGQVQNGQPWRLVEHLSSSSIGDLNDVNISGISAGQFLEWDGTRFVAASASAADLTSESITELQDVSTDTPNNGDVLTWDSTSSAYKPRPHQVVVEVVEHLLKDLN